MNWSQYAGLRNVIVHQYFGVDLDAVWAVVERDIQELRERVIKIRAGLGDKELFLQAINPDSAKSSGSRARVFWRGCFIYGYPHRGKRAGSSLRAPKGGLIGGHKGGTRQTSGIRSAGRHSVSVRMRLFHQA
jgi:hypothetical protein